MEENITCSVCGFNFIAQEFYKHKCRIMKKENPNLTDEQILWNRIISGKEYNLINTLSEQQLDALINHIEQQEPDVIVGYSDKGIQRLYNNAYQICKRRHK